MKKNEEDFKKKISIVIPTLNEEKHIANLLKSLRNQTYKGQIEIIVADGNSEDKTREIAKEYADKVIIETIRNAAAERQAGSKHAEGEILLFIDADSEADVNWVKEMVSCFDDPKVVTAGGKVEPLEKDFLIKLGSKFWSPAVYFSLFFKSPLASGQNLAIRKDIFDKIGGFKIDKKTGEDTILVKMSLEYGKYKYNSKAKVFSSIRRIKNMGKLKYLNFHIKNYFNTQLFNKSSEEYDPIRT